MSLLMSQRPLGAPQMTHSLMMDGAAHYGSWTPGSSGNRRKFKIVLWVRRWGGFGSAQTVISAGAQDGNTTDVLQFDTSDRLDFLLYRSGVSGRLVTNAVFRDSIKWYCIEIEVDTTQATAANRLKMKVNGVEQTYSTATYPSQNFDCTFNHTYLHTLGRTDYATAQYASIYVSDFYQIDGDVPASSNFYKTFANTTIIEPRIYSGDVGLNGRRYRYRDGTSTTTIGYDDAPLFPSGGHTALNHMTLNSMATTDRVTDSPTNTYPIWSAIDNGSAPGIGEGARRIFGLGSGDECRMTAGIQIDTYAEFVLTTAVSDGNCCIGVAEFGRPYTAWTSIAGSPSWVWVYRDDGYTINNGAGTSGFPDLASGERAAVAVKAKGGGLYDIWFGKASGGVTTWLGSGDPAAGTGAQFTNISAPNGLTFFAEFSAGSASTTYWDACIEQAQWAGACPTGFKAHGTKNLPTPPVRKASLGFSAQLWVGTGASRDIALPFDISAGGLAWPKSRSAAYSNYIYDTARGANNALITDATNAEASPGGGGVTAFNASSVSLGTFIGSNENTKTYVGWFWKRGAQFGFDIALFTAGSVAAATNTVAHALGGTPNMVILKDRQNAVAPHVWHSGMTAGNYGIPLNGTAAQAVTSWANSPYVDANNVYVRDGAYITTNANGVLYFWRSIDGFSAFPKYVSNGATDGVFSWMGIRPQFVMLKNLSAATAWRQFDKVRDPYNVAFRYLEPNAAAAENPTSNTTDVDLISGGLKVRGNASTLGASGNEMACMAFGDPVKTAMAA